MSSVSNPRGDLPIVLFTLARLPQEPRHLTHHLDQGHEVIGSPGPRLERLELVTQRLTGRASAAPGTMLTMANKRALADLVLSRGVPVRLSSYQGGLDGLAMWKVPPH